MNGLMSLLQALVQFLTGPFGVLFITAVVIIFFLAAAARFLPVSAAISALVLGACAMTAAFFVSWIGIGGGI
jgi:hypothetical protein